MATTISNKRILADVSLSGENIILSGRVELNDANQEVIELNGDIRLIKDKNVYVGNFSLLGININERAYIPYRTEASGLVDRMMNEVNAGTAVLSE